MNRRLHSMDSNGFVHFYGFCVPGARLMMILIDKSRLPPASSAQEPEQLNVDASA